MKCRRRAGKSMPDNDDPSVGDKKPRVSRRFKKGQSGNTRGRPKGSRNFSSIMDELLDQRIRLTIDGRQVVLTGRQALGMQMVNRAVAGDVRMIQLLQKYGCFERANEPMVLWLSEIDMKL
jgi:Family of unknown function (DUF5681)